GLDHREVGILGGYEAGDVDDHVGSRAGVHTDRAVGGSDRGQHGIGHRVAGQIVDVRGGRAVDAARVHREIAVCGGADRGDVGEYRDRVGGHPTTTGHADRIGAVGADRSVAEEQPVDGGELGAHAGVGAAGRFDRSTVPTRQEERAHVGGDVDSG